MVRAMRSIAIVTFDGFNEIDSFVALHILARAKDRGLRAFLACPRERVTSMNGVALDALEATKDADAVIVGSGTATRDVVADPSMLARLALDPKKQLVGSQCSGALVLAKLGLLRDVPACTDNKTRPWLQEAGVRVLDRPFVANGNVATAGGCLSSVYLATWMIATLVGEDAARAALDYVAPVGEGESFVARAMKVVRGAHDDAI
jgi:transcriptional regulator GlxA family with amidase domain